MFVVRISDGLGNQLFQYAFSRQLARRHPDKNVLYHLAFGLAPNETRRYLLPDFGLALPEAGKADIDRLYGHRPWWTKFAPRFYRPPQSRRRDSAPWTYQSDIYSLKGDAYFEGFWQCPKYFEEVTEELRRDLVYRPKIDENDAALIREMAEVESVSLHVRRGDYASSPNLDFFGLCSADFYQTAIRLIASRLHRPKLYLFSDNPEWVEHQLQPEIPSVLVSQPGQDRTSLELWMMSRCHHHIIANSSYSWWGSWLNPNPNKLVIAPRRWILGSQDYEGVYPPGCLRL